MGTIEDVSVMLRSVLQSTQEGVRLDRVEADYRTLTGDFIPYRKLRFPNLEALLKAMPEVVRINKNNRGELMVQAVSDSSTEHIASLVARQRVSKPRARVKGSYRQPNRYSQNSRPPARPYNVNYGRARYSSISRPPPPHSWQHRVLPQPKSNFISPAPPAPPASVLAHPLRQAKSQYQVPPRFLKKQMMQAHHQSSSPSPPPCERRVAENPMTYKKLLEEYAQRKGLGCLVFKTFQLKNTNDHTAKVTIQDKSFGSYPTECATQAAAEEEAARVAVETLGVQPDKKLKKKISNDVNSMFLRIREIVESHPNGVIHYQVPIEYQAKYQEDLPEGWLAIVMSDEILRFQEGCEGRIILYPFDGVSRNESETSSNSDSTSSSADLSDSLPPRLLPPEDTYWEVYVSHVSTAANICCRFVGPDYSEKYDELTSSMVKFYEDDENRQTAEVIVGNLYAVKAESWFRVEVNAIADGKATVYFVDHGGLEELELNDLFVLHPKFVALPFQAVECILHELEDFEGDTSATVTVYEMAAGQTLIAEVISRDEPFQVVLYDTSTSEDINFNELLQNKIMDEIIASSNFPEVGFISEAYLRHVSSGGDVYIQPHCRASRFINQLLKEAATKCESHLVTNCEEGKMYLGKYSDVDSWHRALATSTDTDGEVNLHFIDTGKLETIPISNLRELDAVKRLTRLPSQCCKCKLHSVPANGNLEWGPEAVNKLVQMAPEELLLILKVVNAGTDNDSHIVELFKRLQPLQELVSINSTLALNTALFRKKEPVIIPERSDVHNNRLRFETLSLKNKMVMDQASGCQGDGIEQVAASRPLDGPTLPDVGSYLDVHVTMAASPSNFVCQLWMSTVNLERLTEAMQEYYNNTRNLQNLMPFSVAEGNLYACKHVDDGLWYRVQVKGSNRDMTVVSIYYVDFGDTVIATYSDLQPLPLVFQSLPYQALFCKLAHAVPLNDDWRPEDCVRFQSLVVNKEFVAMVTSKGKDSSGMETVELDLIDTSDPVIDISVGQILVDEKRARSYSST